MEASPLVLLRLERESWRMLKYHDGSFQVTDMMEVSIWDDESHKGEMDTSEFLPHNTTQHNTKTEQRTPKEDVIGEVK